MQALECITNRIRLAEFIRSRRERFSPADFGLPQCGRRRTPGLRREEVAQLAGISIAYYTWIEQGREMNLSPEVLNAISRALRLSQAERTHIFTLAGVPISECVTPAGEKIHPTLAYLMENSPSCSITYDPWFNVLGATALGRAVYGTEPGSGHDSNILYRLFSDAAQRRFWADWESEARMCVGMFRQSLAKWPAATSGQTLLEELIDVPGFLPIWQAYEVRQQPSPDEYFRDEPWRIEHLKVGTLRIHRIATAMPVQGGPTLVLSSPADSETLAKFDRLTVQERPRTQFVLVKA